MTTGLISAICTPLEADGSLHRAGLEAHLDDQWRHGISGVLAAGTMGLMQLQSDRAYAALISETARLTRGRGEVLVGVGDTSLARTRARIELTQQSAIDGVVVLTPYFLKFGQAELIDYYRAVADLSTKPVYIYLLPALTGVWLEPETVIALSEHPNIRGIKCSVPLDWARQLRDRLTRPWRVIPAQPQLVDFVIRCGFDENLDGLFAVFPRLSAQITVAARGGRWDEAAEHQRRLAQISRLLTHKYPLFPACTALLNARGITGNFAPVPLRPLDAAERERFLSEPLIQQHLEEERAQR